MEAGKIGNEIEKLGVGVDRLKEGNVEKQTVVENWINIFQELFRLLQEENVAQETLTLDNVANFVAQGRTPFFAFELDGDKREMVFYLPPQGVRAGDVVKGNGIDASYIFMDPQGRPRGVATMHRLSPEHGKKIRRTTEPSFLSKLAARFERWLREIGG